MVKKTKVYGFLNFALLDKISPTKSINLLSQSLSYLIVKLH